MKIVVDASAGIAAARSDYEQSATVRKILEKHRLVLTPSLYVAEVTNAVWKFQTFSLLPIDKGTFLLNTVIGIPDSFISLLSLYEEAILLSMKFKASVYDMFYLVLAVQEQCGLLTLDKILSKMAKEVGIEVFL